jgi:peptidoglycan biosynthesis protein MviN/MurJ (putative lipid II flippase)
VSAFQYAAALVTATIGLVSGPLSGVLWPRFLRLNADGDDASLSALLGDLVVLVGLPLSLACIFVFRNSGSIVHVLYARGDFGAQSARITATALAFLIFAAVPACLSQVVGRLLNAQGNYRAMAVVSVAMATSGMTLLAIGGATGNHAVAMSHWLVANLIGAILTLYLAHARLRSGGSRVSRFARGGLEMAVVLGVALLVAPRVEFQESKIALLLRLVLHFVGYAAVCFVAFALVYRKRIRRYLGRPVAA